MRCSPWGRKELNTTEQQNWCLYVVLWVFFVFLNKREAGWSELQRGWKMLHCWLWRWRKGPQGQGMWVTSRNGKASLPYNLQKVAILLTLWFQQSDDLENCKITNILSEATKKPKTKPWRNTEPCVTEAKKNEVVKLFNAAEAKKTFIWWKYTLPLTSL